jgi:hypothetical protein
MPEDMIPIVLGIIETLTEEDQVLYPYLIKKLDDENKKKVLEDLKKMLNKRIELIEKILVSEVS